VLLLAACNATIEDTNAPRAIAYDGGREDKTSFTSALPIDDGTIASLAPATLPAVTGACRKPTLAKIYAVSDGDTVDVNEVDGTAGVRVRLIGVDAPEISHEGKPADCFGDEAATFTKQLLNHFVWLTFGTTCTDPFGRTLAYVHLNASDAGFYQRQLLRRGYAKAFIFDDNEADRALFESDESIAKRDSLGLWGKCRK
jgi:micrococcal nuclease